MNYLKGNLYLAIKVYEEMKEYEKMECNFPGPLVYGLKKIMSQELSYVIVEQVPTKYLGHEILEIFYKEIKKFDYLLVK